MRRVTRLWLAGFVALLAMVVASSSWAAAQSVEDWAKEMRARYGGMTIVAAFATHTSTEAIQALTPRFTELTGIRVIWDVMEESFLRNKLLLEHEGKTGAYDVVMIDAFSLPEYVPKGVILPLEPFLSDRTLTPSWYDYEDILPAYRDGIGRYAGTIYGIPIAGESRYVGYRKDIFERYGLKPPETMHDLLAAAKALNGRERGLYGIAMRAQKGIHFASGWMQTLYQMGGQFVDQKTWKVLLNTPETIASLKFHVELLKQGPPDIASYTHEEALSAFTAGRTALWFDATALTPWILDPSRSRIVDRVGFIPPPSGPAGAYGALAGWDVGISADIDRRRQEAAWAFIVWVTSKVNAKEYVRNGGPPVRRSAFTDPEIVAQDWTLPIQLQALDRAANLVADGIIWIPPHIKIGQALDTIGSYGSRVLVGELSAEEAMARAQQEVEAIMARP